MPNAVGERKRMRLRKAQVVSDSGMDKTSEDNWFVHPKIADDFIAAISQPIPTIRLAESVKPLPKRRGDAGAICAAEAKRARKRAKRLEARRS